MRRLALALLALVLLAAPLAATEYYGSNAGTGVACTIGSPCTFATLVCMNGCTGGRVAPVPGDTLWMRGGAKGTHTDHTLCRTVGPIFPSSAVNGTVANRITLRNYQNEHVVVDGNFFSAGGDNFGFQIKSSYWTVWGINVYHVNDGTDIRQDDTLPYDPLVSTDFRTNCLSAGAMGTQYINMFLHDCNNAVSGGTNNDLSGGRLFYGNVFYNGGFVGPERGHGHSWYFQNSRSLGEAGRSLVQDNVSIGTGERGTHSYSSGSTSPVGFITYDHNVEARNGITAGGVWKGGGIGGDDSILYGASGSSTPPCNSAKCAEGGILNANYTYGAGAAASVGYTMGSLSFSITNNFFANTGTPLVLTTGATLPPLTITGNTFFTVPNGGGGPAAAFTQANYPSNTYLNLTAFPTTRPDDVFYRINQKEAGRGFVVYYNWDLSSTVTINLDSMGGYAGEKYQIHNGQAPNPYLDTPIATGTCGATCGTIVVSATTAVRAQPSGTMVGGALYAIGPDMGPRFNVFLLYPDWDAAAGTPTPVNTPTFTFTSTPTRTNTRTNTATPGAPTNTPTPVFTPSVTVPIPPTFTPSLTPTPTAVPLTLPPGFEAELCTIGAPMVAVADAEASGGFYVSSPTLDSGTLTCQFAVPTTGEYRVWARVYGASGSADSFYVALGAESDVTHIFDVRESQQECTGTASCRDFVTTAAWWWTPLNDRTATCGDCTGIGTERRLALTAGTNTLTFRQRDPDTRLDRIIVTSDVTYDPGVIGQPTPTRTPGVGTLHYHRCKGRVGWHRHPITGTHRHNPCPWR